MRDYSISSVLSYKSDIIVGTTDSGIFRSYDGGKTFEDINEGLSGKSLNINALFNASNIPMYACTDSGLFQTAEYDNQWSVISDLPTDGKAIGIVEYGLEYNIYVLFDQNRLYHFDNNLWSWETVTVPTGYTDLTTIFSNGTDVFVGSTDGDLVYKCSGSSCAASATGIDETDTPKTFGFGQKGDSIFAMVGDDIYFSTNAGSYWDTVTSAYLGTPSWMSTKGDTIFGSFEDILHITTDEWQSNTRYNDTYLPMEPLRPTSIAFMQNGNILACENGIWHNGIPEINLEETMTPRAVSDTDTSMLITWNDTTSGFSIYLLELKEYGAEYWDLVVVFDTFALVTDKALTDVETIRMRVLRDTLTEHVYLDVSNQGVPPIAPTISTTSPYQEPFKVIWTNNDTSLLHPVTAFQLEIKTHDETYKLVYTGLDTFFTTSVVGDGEYFFRVKAINDIGSSDYNETSISVIHGSVYVMTDIEPEVYPNPFGQILNIAGINSDSQSDLLIYNNVGVIVYQTTLFRDSESASIDLQELPVGVYFLHIENNDQRFVKQIIKY